MPEDKPDLVWDPSDHGEDDVGGHFEWEFLIDAFTEFIQEVHPDGDWHCVVENFGWQHKNGYKDFDAGDGVKLLSEVLPNTDCTDWCVFDTEEEALDYLKETYPETFEQENNDEAISRRST